VEKPAVSQAQHPTDANPSSHTMAGHRDMRPAVYFKDLKKRSLKLEEEKSEHLESLKREAKVPERSLRQSEEIREASREVETINDKAHHGRIMGFYKSKIQLMQNAIEKEDLKLLSEAIYEIKMNRESEEEAFGGLGQPPRKPSDQDKDLKEKNDLTKIKSDLKSLINRAEELLIQISVKI